MDIYTILTSKPHNPHYLNRYIKFIQQCQRKNVGYEGYVERHHICPKAKDMFPEYKDFQEHPWNCIKLTLRQHFIAHLMLWKVYFKFSSQALAIWRMKNARDDLKIKNSRMYEKLKLEIANSIVAKDFKGNTMMISKDDPRYLSGELVHISKGVIWVTNGIENTTISKDIPIPKGWWKGITKSNIIEKIFITNGIENKQIPKNSSIPQGWKKGMTNEYQWITDGFGNQQISKSESIPEGWRKGRATDHQWITNGVENKQIPKNSSIPQGWKKGMTKLNIAGKICITNGQENRMINKDALIPEGWWKGRANYLQWITNGTKNRRIPINESIPEGWRRGKTTDYQWITNGVENKQIPKDVSIPENWRKGRTISSISGKICITNGQENRMINKDALIPEGWWKGMTKKYSIPI